MTEEDLKEAERLAKDAALSDFARMLFRQGYAAGCEAKRADVDAERARSQKLLENVKDFIREEDGGLDDGNVCMTNLNKAFAEYEASRE